MTKEDSPVTANRRNQLRRWIDAHHGGSQASFIASTNDGTKQLNQGELSALLKNKSFGERKARALEQQTGMPDGYLDQPPDKPNPYALSDDVKPVTSIAPPLRGWPFPSASLERIMRLKKGLGARAGLEALHDMDKTLEIVVLKWEKKLDERNNHPKSGAA